jgi:plastocyanin
VTPVRRSAGPAAALTVLAVLAGCSGAARADVSLVSVFDSGFAPATLTVPVGTEVRWVNDGSRTHTITTSGEDLGDEPAVPAGAETFDSGPLRVGDVFAHRFDVAGSYVYWCRYHRDEQMVATVEVEP